MHSNLNINFPKALAVEYLRKEQHAFIFPSRIVIRSPEPVEMNTSEGKDV